MFLGHKMKITREFTFQNNSLLHGTIHHKKSIIIIIIKVYSSTSTS